MQVEGILKTQKRCSNRNLGQMTHSLLSSRSMVRIHQGACIFPRRSAAIKRLQTLHWNVSANVKATDALQQESLLSRDRAMTNAINGFSHQSTYASQPRHRWMAAVVCTLIAPCMIGIAMSQKLHDWPIDTSSFRLW